MVREGKRMTFNSLKRGIDKEYEEKNDNVDDIKILKQKSAHVIMTRNEL